MWFEAIQVLLCCIWETDAMICVLDYIIYSPVTLTDEPYSRFKGSFLKNWKVISKYNLHWISEITNSLQYITITLVQSLFADSILPYFIRFYNPLYKISNIGLMLISLFVWHTVWYNDFSLYSLRWRLIWTVMKRILYTFLSVRVWYTRGLF